MKREVGLKTVVEYDWFFNILRCKGIKLYLFLMMMMMTGGMFGQYSVNFEGSTATALTTNNYTTPASVTISGITWSRSEILLGNLTNDWKNGTNSARFRNRNGSNMTMTQNKTNGIGNVSFSYRRYGTDSGQQEYRVDYSDDNGANWNLVGTFTPSNASVSVFSEDVDVSGNIRIRIIANTSPGTTGDRRWNLDDFLITDYVPSTPTPSLTLATSPATDPVAVSAMDYTFGSGPSTPTKTFTVTGSNLAPADTADRYVYIEPTGTNFEFSLDNTNFSTSGQNIEFPTGDGFSATTVYVRLKAGLPVGNYTDNTTVNYYNAPTPDLSSTITLSGEVTAAAATISTGTIAGSPFCVTASTGSSVSVPFTSTGTFTSNTYTAQLSNASGSFTSPVAIGTLVSNANTGTITATIPANTATGTGYRIRVIANSPATTGSNNGTNLTITLASSAIAPTTTQNLPIGTNGNLLTATDTGASSRIWKYSTVSGGPYTTSTGITASTYTPNFPSSGTFYIVCESTFACSTITSNQVTVNVSTPTISLTGSPTLFSYAEGQGPSTHQTVVVSGTSLTDNIVINAPTNWEISTTAIFTTPLSTITLTKNASNAVANNNIHIRLKSGLAQGLYSGSLQVTSLNAVTQTANMNGEVTAAVAFINVEANTGSFPDIANGSNTPTSLQNTLFAARAIGTSEAKSFRIQNLGGATLNLSGLTLTGTNPGDFSISTPPPATVAAGATVTFEVSFSPNAVGQRNAIVNIPNTSSNASTFTFNVQGSGTNPEIGITGNGNNIPNGNTAISATDNTSIGAANANTTNPTTASKTFIISNTGNAVLTVSNITLTGTDASQFSVSPTSASITASSTATITVTFAPTSYGEKNAILSIINNDSTDGEGSYTFAVQGNALSYVACEAGALGPLETIAIQDFETSPATPTWTYTNTGGAITGGSAYANGPNIDKFIGTRSFQVGNTTGTLNFNFDTSSYEDVEFGFRLAAFGSDGSNGLDAANSNDYVRVEISSDGTTWYKQVQVGGFSNARWSFSSGTGIAQMQYYEGTGIFDVYTEFAPSGGGSQTTNGFSTIRITDLPVVATLYVRVTTRNNAATETWAIDNITLKGKTQTGIAQKTWNGTAWSGDGLPPTPSQKAIIDGNLTLPYTIGATTYDTLEGCECQVNPGRNVTVGNLDGSVPATLNIQGIVENNGTITLNNNSSLVQHNDQAINTGQASIKRTTQPMYRYDYTYWSSPVQPDPTMFLIGRNPDDLDIPGLSPLTLFNKYFEWNAAGQNWNGIPYGNQAMTAGRGYIVRAPQTYDVENTTGATPDHYDANFIGVPNNGIIRHPVSGSSDVDENQWNLLGNPYPSAIDADAFLELNADENEILGGTLYFWTHNTTLAASGNGTYSYNSADYAAWNGAGSVDTKAATSVGDGILNTNAPAGNIAAGQSFFIKGISDATNAEAIFNNNMRITSNNNQFFRPAPTTPVENWQTTGKHRVWLNLTGQTKGFSQTLVGYIENATNDLDNRFDGESFGGNQVTFYSILENKNLVIQGRALPFDTHDEVPLGYKTTLNGMLTISIDHLDGLLEGQDIYLQDQLLNIVHDLKASAYNFTTVPGTFNERFVLRYLPAAELSNPDHAVANSLIVFQNNDIITIKSQIENLSEITIYDITGKMVFENKSLSQKEYSINQPVLSHQVVIIKAKLENGVVINKKIVF